MLHKIDNLMGSDIVSEGGKIGTVADILFDDRDWVIRYCVVDIGNWLEGRKVLIPPALFTRKSMDDYTFAVSLTRDQIESSPPLSANAPVSLQHQLAIHEHYGWNPQYIGVRGPLGEPTGPVMDPDVGDAEAETTNEPIDRQEPDPHLRSYDQVAGYHIQATDDEIGHVEDFFVDDESWKIRYLVVDTRNWLPGRKVVLATDWIDRVSWDHKKVFVAVAKETIKNSPEYIPTAPLTRSYEEQLHRYYERPTYWE